MPRDTTVPPPGDPRDAAGGQLSRTLADLQAALVAQADQDRVALRGLLSVLRHSSFPMLMLIFALLLVSPLSAIPGATSLLGLTIAAILAQFVLGRRQVWLPDWLLDRSLPVQRTRQALDWMQRPVGWFERRLRPRLTWAVTPPLARVPAVVVLSAALCMPLLELIPGSGTSLGAAIALFSAGLLARDGLFVLIGAGLTAILPVTLWVLLT